MNNVSRQKDIAVYVEGWDQGRLGRFADVTMGQSPPSSHVSEGEDGIPFLQGNAEFSRKHPLNRHTVSRAFRTVPKDDILMSVRAPVGDLNLADKTYCIGRGLCGIRFVRTIEQPFGWYIVHHTRRQLNRIAQGSTFEAVGRQEVESINLVFPTNKTEQSKIAEVLSTCDEAIEQTEAIIAKYKRIKQGLMQDLLTKGIDEDGNIRSEKTHKFKNSPLGRIPVEWDKKVLGQLIELEYGASLRDDARSGEGMPVYGSNGIVGYHDKSLMDGPGIIVGRKGSVGKVIWSDSNFWPIDTAYFVNTKGDTNLKWIYYLLRSLQLSRLDSSTGVPGLNRNDVYRLAVQQPPETEQSKIAGVLSICYEVIEQTEATIAKYERIKQGLMQDLLSGKVRVTPLMQKV